MTESTKNEIRRHQETQEGNWHAFYESRSGHEAGGNYMQACHL